MKIKEGFVLREVAGNSIVVAIGKEAVNFNGMLTINGTGTDLWKMLEKGADKAQLLEGLKKEYEISDEETVKADIDAFVKKLSEAGLLEE